MGDAAPACAARRAPAYRAAADSDDFRHLQTQQRARNKVNIALRGALRVLAE